MACFCLLHLAGWHAMHCTSGNLEAAMYERVDVSYQPAGAVSLLT